MRTTSPWARVTATSAGLQATANARKVESAAWPASFISRPLTIQLPRDLANEYSKDSISWITPRQTAVVSPQGRIRFDASMIWKTTRTAYCDFAINFGVPR